ncbi:hypothetical protein EVAR_88076_1 [Eumeta japonica]|uniref:Uncharacterized protein n=1 Tax=Eumeta variegata TaxID=151549 RepID=A0A4C1WGF2_EUMVA|nr:hypothetical protein EVAR_88076_1 [Eumeta japonica]
MGYLMEGSKPPEFPLAKSYTTMEATTSHLCSHRSNSPVVQVCFRIAAELATASLSHIRMSLNVVKHRHPSDPPDVA